MKKLITLLLAVILSFSATSCTTLETNDEVNNPPVKNTLDDQKAEAIEWVNDQYRDKMLTYIWDNIYNTYSFTNDKLLDKERRDERLWLQEGRLKLQWAWMDMQRREEHERINAAQSYKQIKKIKSDFVCEFDFNSSFLDLPCPMIHSFSGEVDGSTFKIESDRIQMSTAPNRWKINVTASEDITWEFVSDVYFDNKSFATVLPNLTDMGSYKSVSSGANVTLGISHSPYANHSKGIYRDYEGYGNGYFGAILYRNGEIRGYTALTVGYSWYKSVMFDLKEGQSVTREQVVELIREARRGNDCESLQQIDVRYNDVNIYPDVESGLNSEDLNVHIEGGIQSASPVITLNPLKFVENPSITDQLRLKIYDGVKTVECNPNGTISIEWQEETGRDGFIAAYVEGADKIHNYIKFRMRRYGAPEKEWYSVDTDCWYSPSTKQSLNEELLYLRLDVNGGKYDYNEGWLAFWNSLTEFDWSIDARYLEVWEDVSSVFVI